MVPEVLSEVFVSKAVIWTLPLVIGDKTTTKRLQSRVHKRANEGWPSQAMLRQIKKHKITPTKIRRKLSHNFHGFEPG